jgi:hypothetical protein
MEYRKGARVLAISAFAFALMLMSPSARLMAEDLPEEKAHSPWSFHAELDLVWLQAGAEYSLNDSFGIQASLGASLISPLMTSYDLVGVWHLRGRERTLQLDLQAGLIQGYFNVLEPVVDLDPTIDLPMAYWLPGAAVSIGYRFKGGHILSFCAGGGVLVGYDSNAWQNPSFFPKVAIQYDYKP